MPIWVPGAVLGIFGVVSPPAAEAQPRDPDRAAFLSLAWLDFDQKQNSGWRVDVNPDRKEYLVAANLIEDYLARHRELTHRQRALLHYRAAHHYIYRAVRGGQGDVREALPHLERAVVPSGKDAPSADWNDLVAATKAFILGDREVLLVIRARLAGLSPGSIKFMNSPHAADDLLNHLGGAYGSWFESTATKRLPDKAPP